MTSPVPGVKTSVIRHLMMLMLLFHLVVKMKAEDHIFSLLPMDHTKLEDSQNMKLSKALCATASATKGGTR